MMDYWVEHDEGEFTIYGGDRNKIAVTSNRVDATIIWQSYTLFEELVPTLFSSIVVDGEVKTVSAIDFWRRAWKGISKCLTLNSYFRGDGEYKGDLEIYDAKTETTAKLPKKPFKYKFFVDGEQFGTDELELLGASIRDVCGRATGELFFIAPAGYMGRRLPRGPQYLRDEELYCFDSVEPFELWSNERLMGGRDDAPD